MVSRQPMERPAPPLSQPHGAATGGDSSGEIWRHPSKYQAVRVE